ncbi:efflux RND transporter periplasmic adaptor subunit [Clostridia bacterium]|nr:efflux RND transporter periplasmic adaptor subunit [Clostridia bacterium]
MGKMRWTLLIFLIAALVSGCASQPEAEEEFRVAVTTQMVEMGSLSISDRLNGTAKATDEVVITAGVPAEVDTVLVSAGSRVSKGDLLIKLDAESVNQQITQANANYSMAKLQLENAKDTYEKTARLYQEGAVSKQQYDSSKSQYELIRDGSFQQARVALDMAGDGLEQVNITAPIDGIVGYVNAQVGQTASMGLPIISIIDLSSVEATFGLSEKQINQVEVGKTIDVWFESIKEEPFSGIIVEASPQADAMTKSFAIKVQIDNPDERIKSGMSCTINLVQDTVVDGLIVSEDAIRYTDNESTVFVLIGETVRQVPVEVLLTDGERAAIRGDINQGDEIVVLGKERLSDGVSVQVIEEGAE